MNIKSLLLGSAAALAAVSGAQAADAVVAAEPEPMEYVRVCDAYGTGFFYILGTETCLKIGGHLPFRKVLRKGQGFDTRPTTSGTPALVSKLKPRTTPSGAPSHSWIRLQGDSYNNTRRWAGGNQTRWWYYFGIGGLEFGRFDSPGIRFRGYGGLTDWGGSYGDEWDRQYVSYTASFDNISAFVAIENDLINAVNYAPDDQIDVYAINGNGTILATPVAVKGRTYMPDVSAGIKGSFGDYEVGAFVGYDESLEILQRPQVGQRQHRYVRLQGHGLLLR